MAKKKIEENKAYICPCGSSSFVQEGTANFKEEVSLSMSGRGMVIEGGCPELDIIDATIKCAKCGAEAE